MGRGTARQVEQLKEHIVAEATRLFAASGFGGASIRDIAKAAGVSKALVLYHFGSKDGLRDRVLSDLAAAWGELLPQVEHVGATGEDAVRAAFVEGVAILRRRPELARLLMREMLSDDVATKQALTASVMPVLSSLDRAMRPALRGRDMQGTDIQAGLVFFGIALLAVVAVFPLDGDPLTDDDADLGVRVLQQGMRSLGRTLASAA